MEPGKEPKTDKLTVLGEALRMIRQFQVENHQLKQLNKFLEVRRLLTACGRFACDVFAACGGVRRTRSEIRTERPPFPPPILPPTQEKASNLERERAQSMFFQMQGGMIQQHAPVGMMAGGMMAPAMAPVGMMVQQPAAPMLMQPAAMQCMMQPAAGMMAPPQQQQPLAAGTAGLAQQPDSQQQQAVPSLQPQPQQQPDLQQQQQQHQQPAMPAGGDIKVPTSMVGQPDAPAYWQSMVQQSMLDANQDSLLRPPAA